MTKDDLAELTELARKIWPNATVRAYAGAFASGPSFAIDSPTADAGPHVLVTSHPRAFAGLKAMLLELAGE